MDTSEHGGNILKSDVELSALIRRLDNINKYKSFQKWKTKFLDRLDQFLYDAGKDPAQKASEKFDLSLQKNVKQLNKVQDFMSKGDLCETKKSVKASLALQELCNKLTVLNDEIETIIPKSRAEEKQRGFTKFNLGAVLIQEGFPQYAKMEVIRDAVEDIGTKLQNVADRQQLDLFFYYKRQVDRFCDVMADLNLYEIMKKCIEFAVAPEIEESSSEEEPTLINVVIETYDGKTMRLELDPLETVGNIKEAIAPGSGIDADEQILQFNGETLNDDEGTLEQAGVEEGATLWLEPRNISVQVEMPDGASHPLKVALADEKVDVQKRIEIQLPGNIAVDQQVLTYEDGQEYPGDGQTVKQLKLQNGDVLKVSIKLIQVAIETYAGKTMRLELDPTESIGNVKDAIAPGSGIESDEQVLQFQNETLKDPDESLQGVGIVDGSTLWLEPRNITVQVEMPDGTAHGLKLSLQDKPIDIRKRIQVQIPPNIPTDEQVVTYKSEELLDDDSRTVKDMKMQNGDTLNVKLLEFPIKVKNTMDGAEYDIMVNPKKPLSVIKDLLEKKSGIPIENQNLFLDSETLLDSDDTKPAEKYGIVDGTTLDLEPKKIRVTVDMPDGTRQSIDLSPRDDTSDDIKNKIEEKTGVVVRRQVLSHKGNEVPGDSTTNIKDLGMRDGDDIKVDIHKIPISVTTMDGNQIDIEIDPTEPIGTEIKKQIVDESGVPADNQRLFRNRDEAEHEEEDLDDDGKTSEDYSIEAGAALNLEPKIIKVNVQMVVDGSKHVVDLTPRDTSEVIKKKIEKKTGLPPKKQVVSYKGEELPPDDSSTTVKEMGIREEHDLKVSIFKIPITVKTMDGKQIKVMIDPTEPIADVKKQIAEESRVPPDNQRLFANVGEEELDDAKTPEDYGIQADAELEMEPKKIQVNVEMPDGSNHVIDVTPNDTTNDIKQKIEEKTGMIAPRQVVKHKLLNEELPSDGSTVKQMGIKEGDDLIVEIFKIPVTVTTMDGKTIDAMIDPTEPIGEIKKQIAAESCVPADNQRFYMNGEELDDDSKPAQDYGIEAGTGLYMEPKIIKVNVEMPDGEIHSIELTPRDTSADVKAKIENATGMVASRQVVTHNGNELQSDSESTVKDMGIRDGDDLKVDIYKIPITVNTMDGKTIEVMFDPTEPVGNIKKQIEDESGVPADNQRLLMDNGENELDDDTKSANDYGIGPGTVLNMEPKIINVSIETPDGKVHTVALTPRDSSDDIKAKIEKATGIIPERQVLKHKLLGEELPRDKSVKDMGIKEGDDLAVDIFKIPIAVNTMDGQRIEAMIDPTEPTGEIKKMIESESGVPADNQRLFLNGEELDDDSRPAKDYGIEAGAELDMEPKIIKVNVEMPDGANQTIELTPKDTNDDIKDKIEKATGMIVPRQVVKFQGDELPHDGSTVKDIGIREGDDLKVEVFKIPISVTTMDGEKIEATIDPTEALGEIKTQISKDLGVPADNQRIFMNGEELDDDSRAAKDYGIEAGTNLDMEPKTIKVNVTMPDGEMHSVDLTPKDSTEDIKKKIEEKTGMIAPRQVVKHKGNELPQDGTVKDMGIREGDDLDVEIFKIPITVNTMDGKKVEALIDPTEPIGEIKAQISAESGVPAKNQRLFMNGEELEDDAKPAQDYGIEAGSELDMEPKTIKINVAMNDGQTKVVEITPSDTSDVIKEKIAKETGMEPPRQVLKYKGNELPNDQTTAKDMGLREGDELDVDILKIPVTVNTYDGKVIEIMIEPTDKIGQIKKQLEEPSGIVPSNQLLCRDDDVLDDDIKKANDCGIVAGSVLDLEPKLITISVKMPNGEKHNVDIEPHDTPAKIKKRIEDATGMEVPRQVLNFKGEEVPKSQTAMEAGIMPGDNLDVEIFKIPVTVNMMDGKSFQILVDPYDNLGIVKSQIENESGLLPSNQRVFLKKTELENDTKTAKSYGIVSGSVLDVEPRSLNVTVDMPDGTKHTIKLTPNDKEGQVKEKIEQESGMAVRRQIVKFDNKVLPGFDNTVRDMGIQEGSELKGSIFKIPVSVKTHEKKVIPFDVEPIDTIETVKLMIEKETDMAPSKQILKKGDTNLVMLVKTVEEYGIEANDQLTLEPNLDPIIFVDIKSETLFAVDRDEVVKRGILTPNQGNKLDFNETVRDSKKKDELGKIMKDAPLLGVAVQLVVQGIEVDDYDVDDKVTNKWGVTLKKRSKNKKGEELIFVDPKTGSVGELQRKKAVEDGFITPTDPPKGKRAASERREFIKESEPNQQKYDEYRDHIREIYGIALK